MKTLPFRHTIIAAIVMLALIISANTLQATRLNLNAQPATLLHTWPKLMAATATGKQIDVVIYGKGIADLSGAEKLEHKADKTQFVFEALTRHANMAQADLRRDLSKRGNTYDVLWLLNGLFVHNADRDLVTWLGQRQDVADVVEDTATAAQLGFGDPSAGLDLISQRNENPQSVELGVLQVNAPDVWAMGFKGQGIVVADLDTGVQWDHASLKAKYRGWDGITVTHSYNWFDAIQTLPEAFDDNRHGTHTTGTIVGDDGAGNQIGVAPDAKWIACRNMDHGAGTVARYAKCFQFALAPTDLSGNNPNSAKSADITSNSWGCAGGPPYNEEGCEVANALVNITQAMRAAGIMTVASAGNDGGVGVCESVHHAPATLNQAFAVGAVTHGGQIASFSARGPSSFTGRLKPNVVAPGVNVRSAALGNPNGYTNLSGTSMAGPHVSGVVALLWSAAPWLRGQIDETEAILQYTATPMTNTDTACGNVPNTISPNNTFGYGLINAKAAVARAEMAVTRMTMTETNGSLITLTHTITNNHYTLAMTHLVLSITIPAHAELVRVGKDGVVNGTMVNWNVGNLSPNSSYQATFVLRNAPANTLNPFHLSFNRVPAQRVLLPVLRN